MQSSSQKRLKRLQGSSFRTKSGIRLSVSMHWCRMETALGPIKPQFIFHRMGRPFLWQGSIDLSRWEPIVLVGKLHPVVEKPNFFRLKWR